MKKINDDKFWSSLQQLVDESEINIDRPKGSAHPRYPEYIYPYDYGELVGTKSQDGGGIDCWVGSLGTNLVTGVMIIVDSVKKDSEIKILIDCTNKEMQEIVPYQNRGKMAGVLYLRDINANLDGSYAFIDAQNMYMQIQKAGWRVDLFKFRRYLKEKYNIQKAFWFTGYLEENQKFYNLLDEAGFECVFKEVSRNLDGKPKGNVDVDIPVLALDLIDEYASAVIITSDGDFATLVKYLIGKDKFAAVISPSKKDTSFLLRKACGSEYGLQYMDALRRKIGQPSVSTQRKRPPRD